MLRPAKQPKELEALIARPFYRIRSATPVCRAERWARRVTRMKSSTEDVWRERLEEFRASGLSAVEFGRRHGVHPTTMSRWKRVLAAKSTGPTRSMTLARLRPGSRAVVAAPAERDAVVDLTVGRVGIRVRPGFDPELLRAVVAALTEMA